MQVSFSDLRNHTRDILRALDRNELITLLYRGKPKGVIRPIATLPKVRAEDVPAFGMWSDRPEMDDATEYVQSLRGKHREKS